MLMVARQVAARGLRDELRRFRSLLHLDARLLFTGLGEPLGAIAPVLEADFCEAMRYAVWAAALLAARELPDARSVPTMHERFVPAPIASVASGALADAASSPRLTAQGLLIVGGCGLRRPLGRHLWRGASRRGGGQCSVAAQLPGRMA